jgi:Flp pilus assembly protein TadG
MRRAFARFQRRGGTSKRGQALVEMALVVPFLLAFVGGATDMARAYSAWTTLQAATRNAAEYTATNSATVGAATNDARRIVCEETQDVPGFTPGAGGVIDTCTSPTTFVAAYTVSSTQVGATSFNPIATVHIRTRLNFSTLMPYPFLPHGTWTMTANSTYSVVRGR